VSDDPQDIPTRTIGDVTCTDRTGIRILTGLTERALQHRADRGQLPEPIEGRGAGTPAWYQLDQIQAFTAQLAAADADVPTRTIDGRTCTTRAGIANLAGWKPGKSVTERARIDPDFPHPLRKIGRDYWYPHDGAHGVDEYLRLLVERAVAKKPPAVKPGDPTDLLHGEEAADALHITYATLRSYVRLSLPYWTGERQAAPSSLNRSRKNANTNARSHTYRLAGAPRRTSSHAPPRTGAGRPASPTSAG
jgi:hypothetical protein